MNEYSQIFGMNKGDHHQMKKRLACFCAGIVFSACLPFTASAAQTVDVNLPAFDVTLNGIKADSTQSQYPFLVYKDITYVPMTYHDARLLGLETKWSAENGLIINKAAVFDAAQAASAYKPYTGESANSSTYQATIVEGAVAVAGKTIANSQEEYPLLLFRDVTYFPLTWRFAVDEFGWKYTFDAANGLKITPTSTASTSAASGNTLIVTGSVVNIRASNTTDSAVVAKVKSGDILTYITQKDDWYQVTLSGGQTGWIASWLATVNNTASGGSTTGSTSTTTSGSAGNTGNTSGSTSNTTGSSATSASGRITITGNVVNVRSSNTTDSEVVAKVVSGDVLTYTAKSDNWYQVTLSGGKTGWVAGWLATETISASTGSSGSTSTGGSSGSTSTGTSGALQLDTTHQLEMAQTGSSAVVTLNGISATEYQIIENNSSSLTIKINSGNFKPQSYPVNKYGIKSVTVSGQLITLQFSQEVASHTQKFQNSSALVLTAQLTGTSSGSTDQNQTSTGDISTASNSLKVNIMAPTEAKTTTELTIGSGNNVQVTSSTANRIVMTIDNNTMGTFTPINNSMGPLTTMSARSLGNNQIELTITLANGAYCIIDQVDSNLLITAKSRNYSASQGLQGKIIVLDPGHGGQDPGAIGMVLGVTDAEVGLNVCNALKPLLEAQGATVIMTRSDASGYMGVVERAQYSNSVNADLFVSVHANSAKPNTVPYGTQVYYYAPSSGLTLAAQKPIRMELAQLVASGINGQTGRKSDVYTKNLGVLRENNCPSILVEAGFLSNAEEEALLASPEYINKLAVGIYQGLLQYVSVQ